MDRDFIKRYWFLTALILLIPVGIFVPNAGLVLKKSNWVIPVFVGIMLGIAGFTMDTSRLVKQATNFRAVLPVLASIYVFAPAAAFGLAKLFAPEDDAEFIAAMMIMAAQAGSLASGIALTMMAGGNRELALICTLLSNGLTVVLTPFILKLSIGAEVDFSMGKMILRMAYMILLPIAAGQLLRRFIWEKTESIQPVIRVVPQFIILLFVYTGFASGADQLQNNSDIVLRFLAACALLHMLMLGWNLLISGLLGLNWPDRTAVILCGSQKTLPNGIYIWDTFFMRHGDVPAAITHVPFGAVPLVLYHLFQLLVDTLLVSRLEKVNPKSDETSSPEEPSAGCHVGGKTGVH